MTNNIKPINASSNLVVVLRKAKVRFKTDNFVIKDLSYQQNQMDDIPRKQRHTLFDAAINILTFLGFILFLHAIGL